MKNFIGKITAALAMAVLAVVGFGAAPARAATVFNCPNDYVCVFDGTNYGTFHWTTRSLAGIDASPGNCWDFDDVQTDFNNAISSIIVNPGPGYTNNTWKIRLWFNANCTGTPVPYAYVGGPTLSLDSDLSNGAADFNLSINGSNAITGISFSA